MEWHALVIEDSFIIASEIADIASQAGASSVDMASSPAEALASALRRPPALILSDVGIVDGCGPEAVARIRQCLGDVVPVIFITGSAEACRGIEAATILVKPVTRDRIAEAIAATGCV